jgi:small subunit ribosomal protein S2
MWTPELSARGVWTAPIRRAGDAPVDFCLESGSPGLHRTPYPSARFIAGCLSVPSTAVPLDVEVSRRSGCQAWPPTGVREEPRNGARRRLLAVTRADVGRQKECAAMAVVTMKELLASGVHFGHQTRRWNPKMKRFIFTERNGIYIIDLQQSLTYIDRAYEFVKDTVAHGGSVMFVGTKKQAQEAVAEQATRVGMPYVNQRWLGGMLTNFQTVFKRLQRLKELEILEQGGTSYGQRTKKEALVLQREKDKLLKTLGGIREMSRVPSAVWIVDTKKEHIAVGEARKLGIPVVAILDTNCDPDEVDYKIPGNDDAIRSVALLTRVIADAVADGLMARVAARVGDAKPDVDAEAGTELGGGEPLADWERELLVRDSAAASSETATAGADAPAEPTAEPAAEPTTEPAAEAATEA